MTNEEKTKIIDEVAMRVFAVCFNSASNLGDGTSEARVTLFKIVAEISYEAAKVFVEIKEKENPGVLLS